MDSLSADSLTKVISQLMAEDPTRTFDPVQVAAHVSRVTLHYDKSSVAKADVTDLMSQLDVLIPPTDSPSSHPTTEQPATPSTETSEDAVSPPITDRDTLDEDEAPSSTDDAPLLPEKNVWNEVEDGVNPSDSSEDSEESSWYPDEIDGGF